MCGAFSREQSKLPDRNCECLNLFFWRQVQSKSASFYQKSIPNQNKKKKNRKCIISTELNIMTEVFQPSNNIISR